MLIYINVFINVYKAGKKVEYHAELRRLERNFHEAVCRQMLIN